MSRVSVSLRIVAVAVAGLVCVPPLVVLAVQSLATQTLGDIPPARLLELLGGTAALMAIVVGGTLILGTLTALITTRTTLPGRNVYSVLLMAPLVLPAYVLALALLGMGGGQGILTHLLALVGLGPAPVAQGLWAAALCLILSHLPIVHALLATSLNRLDPALEESARLLGDGTATVLWRVVLPQLRTPMALGACLVALYVLSDFGAVSILRYDTFTRAVYSQFRGRVDLAPAFALCGVLVAMAAIVIVVQIVLRGKPTPAATARHPFLLHLSFRARVGASILLGSVILAGLVLPVVTLVTWAVRGLIAGAQPGPVLLEATNTLQLAIVAAGVTTALAVPIALASYRGTSVLGRIAETLPWITHSLPHLAMGLAFLVVSLALPSAFYQSTWVLLLAYAAISLPLAVGALQIGLRQIDPRLLEVSRTLGAGAGSTAMRVVLPLVWRAGATGALLVAVTVLHELPATLLLRPTGTETLAIRLWGAVIEGQYTTGSIAAILLVAIGIPLIAGHHRAILRAGAR